jgi:hypothetical protein
METYNPKFRYRGLITYQLQSSSMAATMLSSQDINMRKRRYKMDDGGPSDSEDDEYTHPTKLTPTSSTYDISTPSQTATLQNEKPSIRPRRSTANYCPRVVRKKGYRRVKRRQTEPPHSTSHQDLSLQISTARDLSGEVPHVQKLVSGQTRIGELRVEDPGQNDSQSVTNLTRYLQLAMPIVQSSKSLIGKAGTMVDNLIEHWRPVDRNGDATREIEPLSTEGATTVIKHDSDEHVTETPQLDMSLWEMEDHIPGRKELEPPVEPLSSSYVNCDTDFDSDEGRQESESQSTRPHTDAKPRQWTAPKEASPPPRHGFPRANEPYKANVMPQNAIRSEDSGFVWNARDKPSTSRLLFDSGTDDNFISKEKATSLGFQPMPLLKDDMRIYQTLGGLEDIATDYVTVDLAIDSVALERHTVSFLVIDTIQIDIVLGSRYLGEKEIWEKRVLKKLSTQPKSFVVITRKPSPGRKLLLQRSLRNQLTHWVCRRDPENAKGERAQSKEGGGGRSKHSSTQRFKNRCETKKLPNCSKRPHRWCHGRPNDCGYKLILRVCDG